MSASPIEDAVFELLARRDAGKSICPSEAAKPWIRRAGGG